VNIGKFATPVMFATLLIEPKVRLTTDEEKEMTKHLTLAVILLLCTLQSAKAQLRVVTELSPPNQMLENNQVTGTSTVVVK